jgi:hypothetical protein
LLRSGICRIRFEYPLPVYDISLARMDLQNPGRGYQLYPGFPPGCVTCGAPIASIDSVAATGTSRGYTSANRRGAQPNGSILPVPSHCMLLVVLVPDSIS